MAEWTLAAVTAGSVVTFTFPVLLLIFGVIMVRAGRRGELAAPVSQASGWVLGAGLVGLALYLAAALPHMLMLGWVSIALLALSGLLCARLLRNPLTRAQRSVSWLLLFSTLFTAAFGGFAIWIAGQALRDFAYNNPNEAEVRAAIAKNPNDAAAHSSLAHLDMMRGDHAGDIAEWQQVLRVEPDNLDALLVLGGQLSQERRISEARPIFLRLAARNDQYSVNARKWLARHGGR